MLKALIVVLALVVCAASVFADTQAAPAASDVVVLTDASFEEKLNSGGTWLIEFYAPWCGHCKKLAPTWDELSVTAKGKFNVAKVDCTVEKNVASRFNIRGFPTIKLFKDKKVYDYRGARTIADFATFAESGYSSAQGADIPPPGTVAPAAAPKEAAPKEAAPKEAAPKDAAPKPPENSNVVVLTNENFASQTGKGSWLIEFYAPWCGHCKKLAPIWEDLATAAKGKFNVAKVDCTVEADLAKTYEVKGYPTVKLFQNGKLSKDYSGARTLEAFTKFVADNAVKEEL